uniref:Uncharacterized protein n=1 Tax=Peronospora matthiolae TaxID=2874970 RepID=A0AAV1TMR0_9STRA
MRLRPLVLLPSAAFADTGSMINIPAHVRVADNHRDGGPINQSLRTHEPMDDEKRMNAELVTTALDLLPEIAQRLESAVGKEVSLETERVHDVLAIPRETTDEVGGLVVHSDMVAKKGVHDIAKHVSVQRELDAMMSSDLPDDIKIQIAVEARNTAESLNNVEASKAADHTLAIITDQLKAASKNLDDVLLLLPGVQPVDFFKPAITKLLKSVPKGPEPLEAKSQHVDDVTEPLRANLDDVVEPLGANLDDVVEPLGANLDDGTEPLGVNLDDGTEPLGANLDDVVEPLGANLDDVVEPLGANLDDVVEPLGANLDDVVEPLGTNLDDVVEPLEVNLAKLSVAELDNVTLALLKRCGRNGDEFLHTVVDAMESDLVIDVSAVEETWTWALKLFPEMSENLKKEMETAMERRQKSAGRVSAEIEES